MARNRKNHYKIKFRRQRGTRNLFFRTQTVIKQIQQLARLLKKKMKPAHVSA